MGSAQSIVRTAASSFPCHCQLTQIIDGFALMFLSVIVIARDGDWSPSKGAIYGTYLACVFCHGILASTMSRIMGRIQTISVVFNFILIFATAIALPLGARHHRNDAHFIFAQRVNSTTWPTGWAFMLAWLSPLWTIGSFDSVRILCCLISHSNISAGTVEPVFGLELLQICLTSHNYSQKIATDLKNPKSAFT